MKKKEKKSIQHKGSYPVDQKEEKSQVETKQMISKKEKRRKIREKLLRKLQLILAREPKLVEI